MGNNRWQEHEDEYLRDRWGETSVVHMSKVLKRSANAIYCRAKQMGLGCFNAAMVDYFPLYVILRELGKTTVNATAFVKSNPGLYIKRKYIATRKRSYIYTTLPAFWEYVRTHDHISLAHLEPMALGVEPPWVDERRMRDYNKEKHSVRKTAWTKREKQLLVSYVDAGLSAEEIAKRLNRTIVAVQKHVPLVTLRRLPLVKKRHWWTEDERRLLAQLFADGGSIETVTAQMGLEREQIINQMRALFGTRNAERLRQKVLERGYDGAKRVGTDKAKAG